MSYQYEEIKCLQFLDIYTKKTKLKSKISEIKKEILKLMLSSIILIFHLIRLFDLNNLILFSIILLIVVIIRIYLGLKTSKIKKETNSINFLINERKIILENIRNLSELKLIKSLIQSDKRSIEGDYIILILSSLICFFIGFNFDSKISELIVKNIGQLLILLSALILFIPVIKYLFNNNKEDIKQLLLKNINLIEYETNKDNN